MAEREQMILDTIAQRLETLAYYQTPTKQTCREAANIIANLRDSKGNRLLGVIAEDQSLPKNPHSLAIDQLPETRVAYKQAQQDMLNANFMKVVKG